MLKPNPNKQHKCKVCGTLYTRRDLREQWCSFDCAVILGLKRTAKKQADQAKVERKKDKAAKLAAQPRKYWLKRAKEAMHAFVRARDEGKPCISCDTILVKRGRVGGDYDAGHFLAVGSHKHLEFEIRNIFGQCKHCNIHLKGNQIAYRERLVTLYGQGYVDDLRADQAPRKLKTADLQAIEIEYKALLKALQDTRGE